MATKWKNTIKTGANALFSNTGKAVLLSVICGIAAFLFLFNLIDNSMYLSTKECWQLALMGDLFLGIACFFGFRLYLQRSYQTHMQLTEHNYENWKHLFFKQQLFLFITEIILLFMSILYFFNMPHYFNYASGYAMVFTALFAFIVCECTTITFMKKHLDVLMEQAQESNRKIVDAAIEAEKKSIEAAIKSEQLKVDLISNVSHDLKTPLTSMVGYIDLMKKEELSDTMADYVEVLSNKAQKLKEMIESLFSLAKTSSGNIELKPEALNLNRLVEQIYADMEDRIHASGLEFVTELTAADTELVTDSSYLYRICQNLIENALKYSAPNTRVFLKTMSSLTDGKRWIRFEITNTASYRMNFTKEQIVERFARGDESRTTDGNGLGLAIVSTYTSALGGQFDVNIDCDQFKAIIEFEKTS